MRTLAVYGGSFDPPGLHHRQAARELAGAFDEVVVVPCGPRPDRPAVNDTQPVHRAVMADLTFGDLPKVRVELFDLEERTFTRTLGLEARFAPLDEVWHVVHADYFRGGRQGASQIQREWERGPELWQRIRFAVLSPTDDPIDSADLPPKHRVFSIEPTVRSAYIRSRVFHHQSIDGMVVPAVDEYIRRHNLFRGVPPTRDTTYSPGKPKLKLVTDPRNERSQKLAEVLRPLEGDPPDLIVTLGGDGTMLHAIREHWRLRKPFFGVNTGHIGFLLNNLPPEETTRAALEALWLSELRLYQLPLLWVEAVSSDGPRQSRLAFNDVWVERATGQTAWIEVKVDGEVRLPKVVADGALVATAAGSTAYARAMGAMPLPFNTPVLVLVGSNVLYPEFWKPVYLPLPSEVELTTLDPERRPLHGYVDGISQGLVRSLRVRTSNIAAAELAFTRDQDPGAKLARIQFPH